MSERYEIKGRVGRGGMSAVYRAYDTVMRRDVAIKRLLPVEETNLNEEAGNLLEREAAALARFQHPNIVTIYALEEDDEGPFVVMELIEGEDLHSVMEGGALSWEDFQDVAPQCLEPLVAAAELNLLHRDIKPGNIMLTMTPADRFLVKILDFGLAKFSQQPSLQTLDQQGSFLGSIDYIAPEQLELKPLDQRTDLYSLGCVLYYALTQKGPFTGENPARTSMNHLKHRCRHIGELRSDVPEPVADWLMKLISREVEDRPRDAAEALDQLMNALKGEFAEEKSEDVPSPPPSQPISAHSTGSQTPAPIDDVLPPGEEPEIPVAKVAEPQKPKILTAETKVKRGAEGPKVKVQTPAGGGSSGGKTGVAVPPPRPSVKRVAAPESPLKGMGLPLAVGGSLLAIIVGIILFNAGKKPDSTKPETLSETRLSQKASESSSKSKQKEGNQSAKAKNAKTLPLPKKLSWPEGNLPVAILPETNGLLVRFSSSRFALKRDYKTLASSGDPVAAWGEMKNRNRKWSMVRDSGDNEGKYLPRLVSVKPEQIAPLLRATPAIGLRNASGLNVTGTGLDAQPACTVFVVARFQTGAGKIVRFSAARASVLDLAMTNNGQLVANLRVDGANERTLLKWGKGTAGVVCLRFDGDAGQVSLKGIRANGTLPPAATSETQVTDITMEKIGVGARSFDSESAENIQHFLFELVVYKIALTDAEVDAINKALASHYFSPGNEGAN